LKALVVPIKYTTKDFIGLAKLKHEDKYTYSEVEYVNSKTKVKIICKKHGSFLQQPNKHLTGDGCIHCGHLKSANAKRKGVKTFINEANKVHKFFYDYSLSKYTSTHTKITIICPKHGQFFQSPASHLRGIGCMECGGKRKLTLIEFIEKANKVHDFRYSYENSIYKKNNLKIEITCLEHGSFYMIPQNHLAGQNCPVCAEESTGRTQRLTNEEFIKKAKSIHQNEYDYRNTRYKTSHTAVEIICAKHGSFFQEASNHLQGRGCNKCYGTIKLTNESFIKKANKVHKNFYDYSKIDYKGYLSNVVIICPVHGEFAQASGTHLSGSGCPSCGKEVQTLGDTLLNVRKVRKYLPGILYVLEIFDKKEHFYKVGITSNSVKKRYSAKKSIPYDYEILLEADIGMIDAYEHEQFLISEYSNNKYLPKKRFNGMQECLNINPIAEDERLKEFALLFSE
jgi:hypothetical protein